MAERFWATQWPLVPVSTLPDHILASTAISEAAKAHLTAAAGMRPRKFTDVQCHASRLEQPTRWTRPRMVFVNSMSDLFHEAVPDHFIDMVFAVMHDCPQHVFQVLTKRHERMRDYVRRAKDRVGQCVRGGGYKSTPPDSNCDIAWPMPNVWLGVSVENQLFADERVPALLQTPAAIRFVSAEPLLGPVVCTFDTEVGPLSWLVRHNLMDNEWTERVDWVIIGGESGPKARPMTVQWVRGIVQECQRAGVPVFVKQMGAHPQQRVLYGPAQWSPDQKVHLEPLRLRSPKGADMAEWDEDLRVRQFPEVRR